MGQTGERDRWRGWTFRQNPDGSSTVVTPNGVRRVYSQELLAETLLGLLEQQANEPDFNDEYLAYWRKVVGEHRYRQAIRMLEMVAAEATA